MYHLCISLHAGLPLRSDYVARRRLCLTCCPTASVGPLIDTWDGDWILSPVSEVWQLTPSLLITSFTQATGLLCLGPHITASSYWVCAHSLSTRGSDRSHLLLLCTSFNFWLLYDILNAANPACVSSIWINLWCCGEWQLIDSASRTPVGSGSYMSPQLCMESCW